MIVVAGGTGFIGKAIVAELAGRGREVAVLSHSARGSSVRVAGQEVPVRSGDVNDAASLEAALAGAEGVVGAVQFKGFPNAHLRKGLTFDRVDRQGTEHLVAAAQRAGVRRYVYISGAGAAPDAKQVWFRAKWGAETAIKNSGLGYDILRPSWVYGPGDRALNRYVSFVRSPLPVVPVIGNGRQRLQPVFVTDVARAVADSLDGAPGNGVCEIGGPDVFILDQILQMVMDVAGKHKPLLHQPAGMMKLLFSPKALLPGLPLPLSPSGLEFALMDALADNSALLARLPDLRLTPLRDGLSSYLAEGRAQPVGSR